MDFRENQQPNENEQLKELIIEGPEFLEKGKNFYEQAPFGSILNTKVSHTGTNLDVWRKFLTEYAKFISEFDKSRTDARIKDEIYQGKPDIAVLFARVFHNMSKSKDKAKRTSGDAHQVYQYFKIWPEVKKILDQYPYWTDYIATQRPTYYVPQGNPKPMGKMNNFPETPTYGKWISEHLPREKNRVLIGIEEVFSQELKGTSINEAVKEVRGGSGKTRMRWTIRNAAEIPPKN